VLVLFAMRANHRLKPRFESLNRLSNVLNRIGESSALTELSHLAPPTWPIKSPLDSLRPTTSISSPQPSATHSQPNSTRNRPQKMTRCHNCGCINVFPSAQCMNCGSPKGSGGYSRYSQINAWRSQVRPEYGVPYLPNNPRYHPPRAGVGRRRHPWMMRWPDGR
jgi:hypothetical protein